MGQWKIIWNVIPSYGAISGSLRETLMSSETRKTPDQGAVVGFAARARNSSTSSGSERVIGGTRAGSITAPPVVGEN
jgi:hypothetical protein